MLSYSASAQNGISRYRGISEAKAAAEQDKAEAKARADEAKAREAEEKAKVS